MASKGYSLKQYKLTERTPQGKMTIRKMTIGRRPHRKMTSKEDASKEDDLTVRQPDNFIGKLECGSAQPSL